MSQEFKCMGICIPVCNLKRGLGRVYKTRRESLGSKLVSFRPQSPPPMHDHPVFWLDAGAVWWPKEQVLLKLVR